MSEGTKRQAATIFNKAATYIRKYGWQVEGMGKDGQPRCSVGALASANPDEVWDKTLSKLMYSELNKEIKQEGAQNLTDFNHKYHDGEKVAQLFEHTASKLRRSAHA